MGSRRSRRSASSAAFIAFRGRRALPRRPISSAGRRSLPASPTPRSSASRPTGRRATRTSVATRAGILFPQLSRRSRRGLTQSRPFPSYPSRWPTTARMRMSPPSSWTSARERSPGTTKAKTSAARSCWRTGRCRPFTSGPARNAERQGSCRPSPTSTRPGPATTGMRSAGGICPPIRRTTASPSWSRSARLRSCADGWRPARRSSFAPRCGRKWFRRPTTSSSRRYPAPMLRRARSF
jgi:hypothetical protein